MTTLPFGAVASVGAAGGALGVLHPPPLPPHPERTAVANIAVRVNFQNVCLLSTLVSGTTCWLFLMDNIG